MAFQIMGEMLIPSFYKFSKFFCVCAIIPLQDMTSPVIYDEDRNLFMWADVYSAWCTMEVFCACIC